MRRSQGYGSNKSSLDLSQNSECDTPGNGSADDLKPIEKQTDQEDAQRKLTGSRGLSHPTLEQQPISPAVRSQPWPNHMSLAAFIGGRATGPRLNRHAPQQDVHDPTQFDQRTKVDTPHPVFGRGGIAMPGMVTKGQTSMPKETAMQSRNVLDRSRSAGPMPNHDEFSSGLVDARLLAETQDQRVSFKPLNGHEGHERGPSISNQNSRSSSPYLRSKETPNSAEFDTNGSLDLPESSTEQRSNVKHSSSRNVSRGNTPDPSPSVYKPVSRPVSRDYSLPSSTYSRSNPSPADEQLKAAPPPLAKKADPLSLAASIGGRATGPRLNRHAPQQDAHDPTQFDGRMNLTAPHPVFGKGGIAMPGMTAKETSSAKFRSSGQLHGDGMSRSQSIGHSEEPQNGLGSRERAISTPSRGSGYSPPQGDYIKPDYTRRPIARSSILDTRTKTSNDDISILPSSSPAASRPYSLRQSGSSTSPVSPSPRKASPVTTPSLARPIQPLPRQSPTGPQIPPTRNPSRAFLRPPAEKEPTPSLSRLKGRGFVQNMIKTSTQLEASAHEIGGSSFTDKARDAPRKSSVLDRWQPPASASANFAPPPTFPKPIPVRKSRRTDQSPSFDAASGFVSPGSLKTAASHPTMSPTDSPRPSSRASSSKHNDIHTDMPQDISGLGSSSTLISYIKPTKTGDDPLPQPAAATFDGQTSLGRVKQASKKSSTSELLVASGQPLKHPTKGRAKKPRKDRDAKQVQHQGLSDVDLHGVSGHPPSTAVFRTESLATSSVSIPRAVTPPNARPTNGKAEQLRSNLSSDNSSLLVSRVVHSCVDQAIIEGKPVSAETLTEAKSSSAKSDSHGLLARRTLSGLTTSAPAEVYKQEDKLIRSPSSPLSPGRHTRIPSTGNRATVMDVAQVWSEQHALSPTGSTSAHLQYGSILQDESPEMIEKLTEAIPRSRLITQPNTQAEKRKSSYEKYSAIILPSLPEEKTPAPSPAATLSQSADLTELGESIANKHACQETNLILSPARAPEVATVNLVYFDYVNNEPLPEVNINAIVNAEASKFLPSPYETTISIDVMRIVKSTAASISKDINIFYDTEVLAIIHRSKSKSSGLVSTKVWSWQGKRSQCGEMEECKLQELAKRYGTTLEAVHQYQEPSELVQLLGGTFTIRQGIRTHWSSENTAMHSVRMYNGLIFIEEHDLSATNMCSGFSYCFTILDMLYVWYGCGSRPQERDATVKYAQGLAAKGSTVVELAEGESDDDDMFWMMLGDDDYAKADYWKWRRTAPEMVPRLWRVDADKGNDACQFIAPIEEMATFQNSVHIIDCFWEYFVLVGEQARSRRRDILLAMSIAQRLSNLVAPSRPFIPTVHVLILPSRLPLDLRLHFRGLDEAQLNNGAIPDHMNILPSAEGLEHLQRKSWDKATLSDH